MKIYLYLSELSWSQTDKRKDKQRSKQYHPSDTTDMIVFCGENIKGTWRHKTQSVRLTSTVVCGVQRCGDDDARLRSAGM